MQLSKNTISSILLAAIMLIALPANAGRPKSKKVVQPKAQPVEEVNESSFDYLYEDCDDDFYYDVAIDNQKVIGEAFNHIGARYSRGSSGPYAFDCSGFTSFVFGKAGGKLGRSSRDQYQQGFSVKKNELQKGDLVFFTSPGSGRGIGHVGIVVEANNNNGTFSFIHASNTGVRVSSSTEAFYRSRYVGARRVY